MLTPEETRLAIKEAQADPEHHHMVEHVRANAAEYGVAPEDEDQAHILAFLLSLEKRGLVERRSTVGGKQLEWRATIPN
jgi:hypothetical protein